MIQFQNFTVSAGDPVALPPLPSAPDQEATKVFQQAYGRPNELAQPVEVLRIVPSLQPTDVPHPAPSVQPTDVPQPVGDDLRASRPIPHPVETPQPVGDDLRASRPVESRPVALPPATPATFAKVVAENVVIAKELLQPEDSVLQAVPEAVAAPSFMTPGVAVQDDIPVAGVAAKISTEVPRTAGDIVLEAASAVADVLLVTPSLMRGEGEVVVQLKPDVLDGSQVRIQVQGNEMKIEFKPVTETIAQLLTEAHPQLVQHLSARIPAFEFAVTVLPMNVTGRQFVRRGGKTAGGEI